MYIYSYFMNYTQDSLKLQKYTNVFNAIPIKELTITRSNIIKQFFIKMNEAYNIRFSPLQQLYSYSEVSYQNNLFRSIPDEIYNVIISQYKHCNKISYKIGNKNVIYHIHDKKHLAQETINDMLLKMNMWLYIAFEIANNHCSDVLDIYIFLTDYKKHFPDYLSPVEQINANTAFTTTCSSHNEIYIYRREEWFKVFIHETFHSTGLDFSDMNVSKCDSRINSMFSTNIKDLRVYESYCETWSNIIHSAFISFFNTKSKVNYELMLKHFHKIYSKEVVFSINQMVLILHGQNLNYEDMVFNDKSVTYEENTNSFAYYIIKTILLFHINDFITWNVKNNTKVINFKKTRTNITSYCDLIEKLFQNETFIKTIHKVKTIIKTENSHNTLRMSVFEML